METPKSKRARKPNFSAEEVILLEEIAQEKNLLLSSLTNEKTNKKKQEKWTYIAQKVSNCGVAARPMDELRDKWKNLKSETLKRVEDQRKTGGGPPKRPAPFEDLVLAILGEKSAMVTRISASVPDVFATSNFKLQTPQPECNIFIEPDILDSSMGLMTQPQVSAVKDHRTGLDGAADQLNGPAKMPEGNNIQIILEETDHPAPIEGAVNQMTQLNGISGMVDPTPQLTSTPQPPEQKCNKRFRRQRSAEPLKRLKGEAMLTEEEKEYFKSQIEVNKVWCNVLPVIGSFLEGQQRIAGLQEKILSLQARKLELEIEEKEGGRK